MNAPQQTHLRQGRRKQRKKTDPDSAADTVADDGCDEENL